MAVPPHFEQLVHRFVECEPASRLWLMPNPPDSPLALRAYRSLRIGRQCQSRKPPSEE